MSPHWNEPHDRDELYTINGGLFQRSGHGLDHITVVVEVESIDPILKQTREMGCDVALSKTSVSENGFYAQITDTEGNIIGLWEKKIKT